MAGAGVATRGTASPLTRVLGVLALAGVVATFMPSTQGLERELQETAAMLECTDSPFLPPAIVEKMAAEGGRGKLQARLTALKQIVQDL